MSEIVKPTDGTTGPGPSVVQVKVQPQAANRPRAPRREIDTVQVARTREQGYRRRKTTNAVMLGLAFVCAAIALIPLFAIAVYVTVQGVSSLNLNIFTHSQNDVDSFGVTLGIGNTILGSLVLVVIACIFGLPIGLFSGIYLSEYGRGRFADAIRFLCDVLAGIPSIVAGLVGYAIVVTITGFSALAGGFALGLLMFPVVARATEEVLRLVPNSLREAGLALGVPRWRVIARVVLPTAASGIITSMLLGIARVTGETAPLLFTSFGNAHWAWNPLHAVGALPQMIFQYSTNSPYAQQHQQAFAGALILVAIVVLLNLTARFLFRQRVHGRT